MHFTEVRKRIVLSLALCAVFVVPTRADSAGVMGWKVDLCGESVGATVGFYHERAGDGHDADYSTLWVPRGEGPEVVSNWLNRSMESSERSLVPISRQPLEPSTCSLLLIPVGVWFIVGCDSGFNIPCPPLGVTLRGDWKASDAYVSWENQGTDHVVKFTVTGRNRLKRGVDLVPNEDVSLGLGSYFESRLAGAMRGPLYDPVVEPRDYYDSQEHGDVLILLQNRANGMLSAFSGIRVADNRQHEAFNLPFSAGVAPNWLRWCQGSEGGIVPTEGHRGDVVRALTQLPQPSTPDEKVFFQQLQVAEPGVVGGAKRRFVGLRSNRAYRLSARLNTMALKNDTHGWQYSLHATYATRDGLTPEQLAGDAPLPNGQVGAAAGRMADYSPGNTTEGKWIRSDTGPDQAQPDIVLPEGYDTIVVWVRFTSQDPEDIVGIDWVQLEDLGPIADQESTTQQ